MPDKQAAWRNTKRKVRRLNDKLGMPVDKNIVETVAILHLLGFNTTASCGGHVRRNTGGPYVMIEQPQAHKIATEARELKEKKDNRFRVLYKKANRLRAMDLQRLSDYLEDFYLDREMNYRSHIIVQSMPMTLNILKCYGAEIALAVDYKTKKEILIKNQDEMMAFTQYLKTRYFARDE